MIKKVKTTDLKLGMYIHDLNVPWLEHGFVAKNFLLRNERQIEKIFHENIIEVLIDTDKGLDAIHAPTLEESESVLLDKMIDAVSEPSNESLASDIKLQWAESKKIHAEAVMITSDILNDVRLGQQVDIIQATPIVAHIADAVLDNDSTLLSLCRIKKRDTYTFQHSVSVSALLITFCHSFGGYSHDQLIQIGLGGLFHDVGKMRIPDAVLNKPGRLTEDEFRIMKSHVAEGLDYLRTAPGLSDSSLKIAAEHHEKYDGSGYPRGLSRDSISQFGQMASIVDVYDAITSTRVYHTGIEPASALKRMFEWSGRHFNETLVQKFIKAIGIYPVGSLVRLESGRLAIVLRQGQKNMLQPFVRVVYNAERGHRLPIHDLNLAAPDCQDHIVGYELPASWGIDPNKIIGKGL
ncbi:MAG: HD-GYP domain-containing protein [Holophagales bacterium]|jgi:putative nucleotidyltransferase with HDIG domain|nr:HD-GYP domain-containing protein [Holophagales bacterium]